MACSKTFSITVAEPVEPPSDPCLTSPDVTTCITTPGLLPSGVQFGSYNQPLTSPLGPAPPGTFKTYYLYSGTLPPTLHIDPDGAILGGLTTVGIYDFVIGFYFAADIPPETAVVCTKCFRIVVEPAVPVDCPEPHNIGELVWSISNNNNTTGGGDGTMAIAAAGGAIAFSGSGNTSGPIYEVDATASVAWCNFPTPDVSEGYEATFNIHIDWNDRPTGTHDIWLSLNGVVIFYHGNFVAESGSESFIVNAMIEPVNNSMVLHMRVVDTVGQGPAPQISGTISIAPLVKP